MSKRVTVITSYSGDTYEKVETDRTTAYHRLQMRPGYVKPVAERFKCDCGYSWEKGRSGMHDCSPHYRAQITTLTAELTSAKEEIAKVWKLWEVNLDQMGKIGNEQVQGCRELTTLLIEQYDAMKAALASERKETERLREALRFYAQGKHYILTGAGVAMLRDHGATARAALQSRQGEE